MYSRWVVARPANYCCAAARGWHSPSLVEEDLGFRVVLSIPIGSGHLEYYEEKVYADPYHQKEITRALSTLIKARTKDAQVIFREEETGKSVQFLGCAREPLQLRLVRLTEVELKRALYRIGGGNRKRFSHGMMAL